MNQQQVNSFLDDSGRFVIENYNWAKPFSNDQLVWMFQRRCYSGHAATVEDQRF